MTSFTRMLKTNLLNELCLPSLSAIDVRPLFGSLDSSDEKRNISSTANVTTEG